MPDTFQALGVLVLALLPGALYVWSFEQLAGAWGIKLADRLLRFIGVSAVLHVTFLPISTGSGWSSCVGGGLLTEPFRLSPGPCSSFMSPFRSWEAPWLGGELAADGPGPAGSRDPTPPLGPGTICSAPDRTAGSGFD